MSAFLWEKKKKKKAIFHDHCTIQKRNVSTFAGSLTGESRSAHPHLFPESASGAELERQLNLFEN